MEDGRWKIKNNENAEGGGRRVMKKQFRKIRDVVEEFDRDRNISYKERKRWEHILEKTV